MDAQLSPARRRWLIARADAGPFAGASAVDFRGGIALYLLVPDISTQDDDSW